jgi:hypothetical protein
VKGRTADGVPFIYIEEGGRVTAQETLKYSLNDRDSEGDLGKEIL